MLSTKEGFVEILCFKQFYKHFVFVEDEEGNRKKRVEKYFEVSAVVDVGWKAFEYKLLRKGFLMGVLIFAKEGL